MICCNDMSLANQSLSKWKTKDSLNSYEKVRQRGGGMYFVKLQLAHLYEGLKIIEEITRNKKLAELIETLDTSSQKSLEVLKPYLTNSPEKEKIEKYIGIVRSNLAFHYDESSKLIGRSVASLAKSETTRRSSITRGDHAYRWYFKLGDDVVNNMVVREIWKVADGKSSDQEIDEILMWSHKLFISFMDFSGELIWKYTEA